MPIALPSPLCNNPVEPRTFVAVATLDKRILQMDVATQLRDLFGPGQLQQLDVVRSKLIEDPTALDNKVRREQETFNGKA